jgi:protein farnesyltransferase subunit beta
MEKLQDELTQLHHDFNKIHSKIDENHRYHKTIKKAKAQFNSKEQINIRKFIFREDDIDPNEESWQTTSEDEPQNEIISKNNETNPASHLFKKSKHAVLSLKHCFNQTNEIFLDVQKTWSLYWSLNSLASINETDLLSKHNKEALTNYIMNFENFREGGFSGGVGYQSNIISTYGAILSLAILGHPSIYKSINREKTLKFLFSMKTIICTETVLKPRLPPPLNKTKFMATFKLSQNGEFDIRNIYTALVFHSLLVLDNKKDLFDGCAEFIVACQSYEGGIGPRPGHEAHGGFTFCGIAALALLGKLSMLDVPKLIRWLTNRQMFYEGGFSGRTNKIVDSCYSFWQGACFNILFENKDQLGSQFANMDLLYSSEDLQKYLLLGCQGSSGGMMDKPSKGVDPYHTMYSLIGLGLSVNFLHKMPGNEQLKEDWPESAFAEIDPIFSIPKTKVMEMMEFWKQN